MDNINWKEKRIAEINSMGYPTDDNHPCFEEVHAIYESKATSYKEFLNDFRDGSTTTH